MFDADIEREVYAVVCPGAKTEGFGHLWDMFDHALKLVEHNTLECTVYYHSMPWHSWITYLTIRGHGNDNPFPEAPDWRI